MIKGMQNALREIERERAKEVGDDLIKKLERIKYRHYFPIHSYGTIATISSQLDYQLTNEQLNFIIFLYISNPFYRSAIEELMTDINYHTPLKKLEEFNAFLINHFNFRS